MNSKRSTPLAKNQPRGFSSAKKHGTPNSNTSVLERRNTSIETKKSASRPLKSQSYMDLTGIGNLSVACPSIKTNLMSVSTPYVDKEMNCACDYSDYLQALMKKQIISSAIAKHKEELNDQLIIQKDNLHQMKLTLDKLQKETVELEKLKEINDLTNNLNVNCDTFVNLSESHDLLNTLQQLLQLLNVSCNKLNVKNIKTFQNEEDFKKLGENLEKCLTMLKRMYIKERNAEGLKNLAKTMGKYQDNLEVVNTQQKFISNIQSCEIYKLFKQLSDGYAEKENY